MEISKTVAEINRLIRRRNEVYDRLTHMTQNYAGDAAQASKDPHKFDELADLDDQIDRLKAQLNELTEQGGKTGDVTS